jgi:23S rRNA (pseudouridine1915-N3)-methyltransferase
MQVHIIAVGRIKEPFLREGIAEYEKRLRPYLDLKIVEITEEKRQVSASGSAEKAAMEREGERIRAAIPPGSFVMALDVSGTHWSSVELADFFKKQELAGGTTLRLLSGRLGLSPAVLSRSTMRLSLSMMTFTHPIARFLLLEQIYRACRINSGEPYHK